MMVAVQQLPRERTRVYTVTYEQLLAIERLSRRAARIASELDLLDDHLGELLVDVVGPEQSERFWGEFCSRADEPD